MTDHNTVSPYIRNHPIRDLCPHCMERPREAETELCEECTLFAQYEEIMEESGR